MNRDQVPRQDQGLIFWVKEIPKLPACERGGSSSVGSGQPEDILMIKEASGDLVKSVACGGGQLERPWTNGKGRRLQIPTCEENRRSQLV